MNLSDPISIMECHRGFQHCSDGDLETELGAGTVSRRMNTGRPLVPSLE